MRELRMSRFANCWPSARNPGRWLIFSARTCSLLRADEELAAAIRAGSFTEIPDQMLQQLLQTRCLVTRKADELTLLTYSMNWSLFSPPQWVAITICPTLACNFACRFCFETSQDDPRVMSEDLLDRILRKVEADLPQRAGAHVVWYGGEPLLALDSIRYFAPKAQAIARSLGKPYESMMITNGFLLTEPVFGELVLELGVRKYQITLVGAREYHDSQRPLKGGGPTYETIMNNLAAMAGVEGEFQVYLRIQVDRHNIEGAMVLAKELQMSFDRRFAVHLTPTSPYGSVSDQDTLTPGAVEARLVKEGQSGLHRYLLAMAEVMYPKPLMGLCGAPRLSSMVIGPSGELYGCWEGVGQEDFVVGNLESGSNPERLQEWYQPTIDPECANCTVLPICYGGCAERRRRGRPACLGLKDNLRDWMDLYDSLRDLEPQPQGGEETSKQSGVAVG